MVVVVVIAMMTAMMEDLRPTLSLSNSNVYKTIGFTHVTRYPISLELRLRATFEKSVHIGR